MLTIYNKATVCPYTNQQCNKTKEGLTLDPHITDRFAQSRDFDELKYLWKEWHDNSGKLMRTNYTNYVNLINKVAIGNGFPDGSKWWQSHYEDEHFSENIDRIWSQIEPLYNELHTYMRYKLIEIYGKQ